MKTQISTLQRGNHQLGIVGTSHEVRNAIAQKVISENPEGMIVRVNGHEYQMVACKNSGGQTISYISEQLPTDIVRDIIPFDTKAVNHPELVKVVFSIHTNMTCEYITFRRVKTTRQWKQGMTINVDEKDVTIL